MRMLVETKLVDVEEVVARIVVVSVTVPGATGPAGLPANAAPST